MDVDNQGGCCDNDAHETLCAWNKMFLCEEQDALFLSFGCKASISDGKLIIELTGGTEKLSYHLKTVTRLTSQETVFRTSEDFRQRVHLKYIDINDGGYGDCKNSHREVLR